MTCGAIQVVAHDDVQGARVCVPAVCAQSASLFVPFNVFVLIVTSLTDDVSADPVVRGDDQPRSPG